MSQEDVLNLLKKNGTMCAKNIAKEIGISPSNVLHNLRKMEGKDVEKIIGYTCYIKEANNKKYNVKLKTYFWRYNGNNN